MFIQKLIITNFRGIKKANLCFHKGLNVLIGENNSGKSTILDAIRICLNYGRYQNDVYIKMSDFHIDQDSSTQSKTIEFDFFFEKESEDELGGFHSLLGTDGDAEKLQAHFRYTIEERKGQQKIRAKVWGGDNEGNQISTEAFNDLVFFIYLDALRDAESRLRPGRSNKVGELFNKIESNTEKQKELSKGIKEALNGDEKWMELLSKGVVSISEHLKGISLKKNKSKINLDFLPFEYRKIVNSIEIKVLNEKIEASKDEKKVAHMEISQNGLGYNNLIYSSVVLSELETFKRQEVASLAALLIEEPEAHLHPQQQNLFFKYLSKLNETIKFQIFITSHSPTLTAKADLKSLICINKGEELTSSFNPSKVLDKPSLDHLHRFLDVTKSQMFFSNGTIMVEGVSEALLLPAFAKIMGPEYDFEKNGIEVVNINGIAFSHFAKLYNDEASITRLPAKCSILTDDDRKDETEDISSRAKKAQELEKGNLKVFLAEKTFEIELFKAGDNKSQLLKIWEDLHPRSKILNDSNIDVYANNFLEKVIANKAKSELAHTLSVMLHDGDSSFVVPEYIKNAIEWVVNGSI